MLDKLGSITTPSTSKSYANFQLETEYSSRLYFGTLFLCSPQSYLGVTSDEPMMTLMLDDASQENTDVFEFTSSSVNDL